MMMITVSMALTVSHHTERVPARRCCYYLIEKYIIERKNVENKKNILLNSKEKRKLSFDTKDVTIGGKKQ
jgi:hypothetical protein